MHFLIEILKIQSEILANLKHYYNLFTVNKVKCNYFTVNFYCSVESYSFEDKFKQKYFSFDFKQEVYINLLIAKEYSPILNLFEKNNQINNRNSSIFFKYCEYK